MRKGADKGRWVGRKEGNRSGKSDDNTIQRKGKGLGSEGQGSKLWL